MVPTCTNQNLKLSFPFPEWPEIKKFMMQNICLFFEVLEYYFRACSKQDEFWYEATVFNNHFFNNAYQFRTNISEVRFSLVTESL